MVEIKRKKGESFEALLRRFTQRVQSGGSILEVKSRRHFKKKPTKLQLKVSALQRIISRDKRDYMERVGLAVPEKKRKGRR